MPDLSDLLGDVYGEAEEPAPKPAPPRAPEWADDEHLDRAFSDWTPGPAADAPAAERSMFTPDPERGAPHLADDLAAALSEAVLAESESEVEEPPAPPAPAFEAEVRADGVADDVAPALTPTALHDLEPEPAPTEPVSVTVPTPVHRPGWQRSDDDIIPTGKSARPRLRPAPRPKKAKAPKAAKPAKAAEADTAGDAKPKSGLARFNVELSFRRKK